jgi:cold-inducible RNA-binding protein
VFVGNLSFRTTEQQLAETLGAAGQVTHVHIGTDRETGRPRGFAFVEFASAGEAAEAIRRFDGQEVDGRKLRVNEAHERPPRTSGPRFHTGNERSGPPRFTGHTPSDGAAMPDAPSFLDNPWDTRGDSALDKGRRGGFKNKGSRRGLRGRKRSLNF